MPSLEERESWVPAVDQARASAGSSGAETGRSRAQRGSVRCLGGGVPATGREASLPAGALNAQLAAWPRPCGLERSRGLQRPAAPPAALPGRPRGGAALSGPGQRTAGAAATLPGGRPGCRRAGTGEWGAGLRARGAQVRGRAGTGRTAGGGCLGRAGRRCGDRARGGRGCPGRAPGGRGGDARRGTAGRGGGRPAVPASPAAPLGARSKPLQPLRWQEKPAWTRGLQPALHLSFPVCEAGTARLTCPVLVKRGKGLVHGEEGAVGSEAGIGGTTGSVLPSESLQGRWGQLGDLGVALTQ